MIRASGPTQAKIMLVGEIPHEQDLLKGEPFVGGAGFELNKMLQEAGTFLQHCRQTMVCLDRVPLGKVEGCVAMKKSDRTVTHVQYRDKWVLPVVIEGIQKLRQEIEATRPNVVIAMGNLALWALTGEWGVGNWRSSVMESTLVPGVKVVPTLNPAMVMRAWELRPLLIHDFRRSIAESAFPHIRPRVENFVIRPTFEQACAYLDDLIAKAEAAPEPLEMGVDIETKAGHTSCIAVSPTPTDGICIPFMYTANAPHYWSLEEEAALVFRLYRLTRLIVVVGQNWNYDAQYIFRHWHFMCPMVADTMIMQHSCFSNLEKSLAFLSSMYLDNHCYWKDELHAASLTEYWQYNCRDSSRTLAIRAVLKEVVKSLGLTAVNDFQQHLRQLTLKAMIRGVRMSNETRAAFSVRLTREAEERNRWLTSVIGHPINIKSPKQMADLFYRELGLPPVKNRKTGGTTTDDEALHKIAVREPLLKPVTRKIAELRSLGVFKSTFVEAPLDVDGRMRSSYNVAGTDTYRFASSKNAFGSGCNLQNIPKGGETEDGALELPNVRSTFLPDPGKIMFDSDLDSADLRIVSWESDCKWMKEQFRLGNKPYIEVMREYYHNPSMNKKTHPREYAMFKSLCHGTNYLGTAAGMAPRIGLLVHEVERIQKWYFGLCPEILKWQNEVKAQVSGRRWIENVFGYRFHFFKRIEGTIFNEAVAWIPQSSVACLINRIWAAIDANLPEVEILMQVHDSLVGQFDSHHGEAMLARIIEQGQIALPYDDPLIIPVGLAHSQKSWGDCRED